MKTGQAFVFAAPRLGLMVAGALLALTSQGCTGDIMGSPSGPSGPGGGTGGDGVVPPPPMGTDPGRIAVHRLNNLEYKNTVKDLVGVDIDTSGFSNQDGKGEGFDNIATEFIVTPEQYTQYFNSAVDISEKTFADATLASKVLTCTPTGAADTACFKTILKGFGLRAWRRPLTDTEITDLTKVGTDAIGMGEDGKGGIKQVVKTMLASPNFLYRIEYDPDPTSTKAHSLDPYELASRLSYLNWSTMPDSALFDLAASGQILKDEVITAQIDRMLADNRAQIFIQRFGGQWLGMEGLLSHAVNATAFPTFDDQLKQAMYQEGLLYFQDFLLGNSKMNDFFSAKINFVNAKLAKLYGVQGVTGTQMTRVENMAANRVGFMGLATFLTNTSFDYRTSPTKRGIWVLENLLCQEIPSPPAMVPKLDMDTPAAMMMAQSENVRKRLEAHRTKMECSFCHAVLDPIGLGLENFDGIGQYRATYANGEMIDASGTYDGQPYNGLTSLATLVSDPGQKYLAELTECSTRKMLTYALSRSLTPTDDPYVKQIVATWKGGGMKDLLKQVALNPTFRFRHGEAM